MKSTRQQDAARGRGRPRLDDAEDTIPVTIRMTAPQKEKLAKLGGGPWVRSRIEKAKLPKE
jgi:hypothetical protein